MTPTSSFSPTMPLQAVFFDFDGVIADTENIHIAAWQRTLAALGWEVSDDVCARAAEVDDRDFVSDLFAKRKIEGADIDGWVRRKQQLTVALLANAPRVYPGVVGLVAALRKRYRLAIVSTTWRENIATVLQAANLGAAFEAIVGKEDVKAVKPDPECYRVVLERFALDASQAVALEDSVTGLTAARSAGLRTLAVGHRLGPGEWVGSSTYLPDLNRIDEVLRHLEIA